MAQLPGNVAVDPYYEVRHQSYLSRARFSNLDGLRAFCILAVIWHHTHGRQRPNLFGRGFLGVDMFFVLSGFLIVSRLLREVDRTGDISLYHFYRRRTLRIFPLYYAVLAFSFLWLVLAPLSSSGHDFKQALPWASVYLSNWHEVPGLLSITWSLACEEQFYLVWPLIQRFARQWALRVLGGLLAVNVGIQLGVFTSLLRGMNLDPAYFSTLQVTFTPILLGVGLAYALHDQRGFLVLDRWCNRPKIAGILACACIVVASLPIHSIQGLPRLVIHLLMTMLLASLVLRETGQVGRLLQRPSLAYVGTLSYGMYLMHMFVRAVTDKVLRKLGVHNTVTFFVLTVAATVIVASFSFRHFESRFLRRKAEQPPQASVRHAPA